MILIKQAQVFAPDDRGPMDVLIINDRIVSIADTIEPPSLPGQALTELDGAGCLLVPGLVDPLVHLSGGGGEGGFDRRTRPLEAEAAFAAGITTAIGCLGTDAITRSHADLLATVRGLRCRGLNAFCLTGSYAVPPPTLTGSVERDLLLIPEMIGLGEVAIADHRGSQADWAALAALTAECRRGALLAGKRGMVLVHLGDGRSPFALLETLIERTEIPRSAFLVTHANRTAHTFEAALDFARAGGQIDFTTSTTQAFIAAGEVPAAEALRRALDHGISPDQITFSSDGQASLPAFDADGRLTGFQVADPGSLLRALQSAVLDHNLPLPVALSAVALNPARLFGLDDVGCLRVGGRGDALLLAEGSFSRVATLAGGQLVDLVEPARLHHG
ncbi:MAG: beta-aspartyl-peptidase [Wenzhouxiangella sp.]